MLLIDEYVGNILADHFNNDVLNCMIITYILLL